MTVTKAASTNSKYFTLTGTLAEVVNALDSEGVPKERIVSVYYNGTNITAIYRR